MFIFEICDKNNRRLRPADGSKFALCEDGRLIYVHIGMLSGEEGGYWKSDVFPETKRLYCHPDDARDFFGSLNIRLLGLVDVGIEQASEFCNAGRKLADMLEEMEAARKPKRRTPTAAECIFYKG